MDTEEILLEIDAERQGQAHALVRKPPEDIAFQWRRRSLKDKLSTNGRKFVSRIRQKALADPEAQKSAELYRSKYAREIAAWVMMCTAEASSPSTVSALAERLNTWGFPCSAGMLEGALKVAFKHDGGDWLDAMADHIRNTSAKPSRTVLTTDKLRTMLEKAWHRGGLPPGAWTAREVRDFLETGKGPNRVKGTERTLNTKMPYVNFRDESWTSTRLSIARVEKLFRPLRERYFGGRKVLIDATACSASEQGKNPHDSKLECTPRKPSHTRIRHMRMPPFRG